MERDTEMMRAFWDAKARENAAYYVSSYRPYDDPNEAEFWEWGERLAEKFLAESEISFDGRESVLEIGCGIGRMTRHLARRFREVHAVDVSPEMISRARENLRGFDNVRFHVGNGRDLAFLADRSVDFVFSYITFQHIPKAAITLGYIREAGRVLRTGGYFYFQVNNMPCGLRSRLRLRTRLGVLRAKLRRGGGRTEDSTGPAADVPRRGPTGLDHPAWVGSRLSVTRIERACRSADLQVLSLRGEGTQYLWVKAVKR